jgi:hypothetical protein
MTLCEKGCGRPATRASGGRWCYWDDPAVEASTKLASRQLGGRRGLLGPVEAALLLEGGDIETAAGRNALRARLMAARASGQLGGALYRDLLAGLSDSSRDLDRQGKPATPPKQIVVSYGNGTERPT